MIDVAIERGSKRVFVIAVDWPGWARSEKDEAAALDAFVDHGPRYKAAIGKRIALPRSADDLRVVETSKGGSNTDFGVPGSPKADDAPVDARQMKQLVDVVESCWATFDAAVARAQRKTLAKGPRGGGRDLAKIVAHHDEGLGGYVRAVGGAHKGRDNRRAFVDALEARRRGELPEIGPRGGRRWGVREAVRRAAWHALDHAWEIEDRSEGP